MNRPLPHFRNLTPKQLTEHEQEFLAIGADVSGEYWILENFLVELPRKWSLSFAAWFDTTPIAYAILSEESPGQVHLHHIMVISGYRGRGLGLAMMDEVERRVIQIGCQKLTLKVAEQNLGALRFYKRLKFEKMDQQDGYLILEKDIVK